MLGVKINGLEILTSTLKMRNGNISTCCHSVPPYTPTSDTFSVQNPPDIPVVDIVVNVCIQIAKLSIYRCRVNNSRPTMAAVKSNKYIMCTDTYIAQTNNTMNKCYGKWASLFHSLQ
jgi:hypothetical protein